MATQSEFPRKQGPADEDTTGPEDEKTSAFADAEELRKKKQREYMKAWRKKKLETDPEFRSKYNEYQKKQMRVYRARQKQELQEMKDYIRKLSAFISDNKFPERLVRATAVTPPIAQKFS